MLAAVALMAALGAQMRRDDALREAPPYDLDDQRRVASVVHGYRDSSGSVWVYGAVHLLGLARLDNHVPYGLFYDDVESVLAVDDYLPLRDGRMPEIIVHARGGVPGAARLLVAIVIGMPLGILAALKQNTVLDYMGMAVAIFGVSVPVIVLGPILVWLFGIALKWLPPTGWGAKPPYVLGFLPTHLGWDYFKYAIMPSVALGLGSLAIIARLTRASLLQTVREDYIRTARAKGLHERTVITRHALKNSLIPVVTILGPLFAALVTGTFVTELIFGIPGMGKYFVTSITNRDYPVIMGTILLYAVFLVIANLIVDLTYAYLDPRIRYD